MSLAASDDEKAQAARIRAAELAAGLDELRGVLMREQRPLALSLSGSVYSPMRSS